MLASRKPAARIVQPVRPGHGSVIADHVRPPSAVRLSDDVAGSVEMAPPTTPQPSSGSTKLTCVTSVAHSSHVRPPSCVLYSVDSHPAESLAHLERTQAAPDPATAISPTPFLIGVPDHHVWPPSAVVRISPCVSAPSWLHVVSPTTPCVASQNAVALAWVIGGSGDDDGLAASVGLGVGVTGTPTVDDGAATVGRAVAAASRGWVGDGAGEQAASSAARQIRDENCVVTAGR